MGFSRSPRASDLAPPHDAVLATGVILKSLATVRHVLGDFFFLFLFGVGGDGYSTFVTLWRFCMEDAK